MLFVSPYADNYRLQKSTRRTSPCVDAGEDDYLPLDVGDLDWDGSTTEVLPKDLNAPASFGWDVRVSNCSEVDMGHRKFSLHARGNRCARERALCSS